MQSSVLSILSEHKSDPTERPVLIELFHTLDTTKKGYLVAEDLKNGFQNVQPFFQEVLGYKKTFKPDWNEVFKCIDSDKDGQILITQFITAACNRLRLVTSESSLESAFRALDKDRDNKISLEDFKRSFGYDNKSPMLEKIKAEKVDSEVWKEIDEAFAEVDTRGHGEINFEEFKTHMKTLI